MRVVVASDGLHGLDAVTAGRQIGQAWLQAGAQVALVPLAETGPSWQHAYDALDIADHHRYLPLSASDHAHARDFADQLDRLVDQHHGSDKQLDPREKQLHPGEDAQLIGLAITGEQDQPLTGMDGLASRMMDRPLAERLEFDRELHSWADELAGSATDGDELAKAPGSGAGWGSGAAIIARGGRIITGQQALGERAGLADTIAAADLVVSCCDRIDVDTWGTGVTEYVIQLATAAERPLVMITGQNYTNLAGQREQGIQAVMETRDELNLTTACKGFARSWVW